MSILIPELSFSVANEIHALAANPSWEAAGFDNSKIEAFSDVAGAQTLLLHDAEPVVAAEAGSFAAAKSVAKRGAVLSTPVDSSSVDADSSAFADGSVMDGDPSLLGGVMAIDGDSSSLYDSSVVGDDPAAFIDGPAIDGGSSSLHDGSVIGDDGSMTGAGGGLSPIPEVSETSDTSDVFYDAPEFQNPDADPIDPEQSWAESSDFSSWVVVTDPGSDPSNWDQEIAAGEQYFQDLAAGSFGHFPDPAVPPQDDYEVAMELDANLNQGHLVEVGTDGNHSPPEIGQDVVQDGGVTESPHTDAGAMQPGRQSIADWVESVAESSHTGGGIVNPGPSDSNGNTVSHNAATQPQEGSSNVETSPSGTENTDELPSPGGGISDVVNNGAAANSGGEANVVQEGEKSSNSGGEGQAGEVGEAGGEEQGVENGGAGEKPSHAHEAGKFAAALPEDASNWAKAKAWTNDLVHDNPAITLFTAPFWMYVMMLLGHKITNQGWFEHEKNNRRSIGVDGEYLARRNEPRHPHMRPWDYPAFGI